jgi:gamma-glutamyltranspeptidase / glutathione hydrolase
MTTNRFSISAFHWIRCWACIALLAGWGCPAVSGAASNAVSAPRGMVVAESGLAAEAGVRVLREGGHAIDAAVATAFALAVTHPAAGNLGGGGFLIYRAHSGEAVAYDFREMAPAAASPEMFLRDGQYDADRHHRSHLAIGVPGTVAGLHLAWRDHGRLAWPRLVEPAIGLAAEGFTVTEALARSLENALPKFTNSPAALAQFTRNGQPYRAGELLVQSDLARTLRRIAERGPAGFYEGEVAERIEQEMIAKGGVMTRADLKAYVAKRRSPIRGSYRGFEVISMPPPSSGGIALIQMLNLLEGFPVGEAGFGSPTAVHWMVESMRRGFADRARHLADPDFNPAMPVDQLISKTHAAALRDSIRPERASVSRVDQFDWPRESNETTHLSVVDKDRNAVALTYTIEESYGSGIVAPGTGFLLNNEMGDFNAGPGLTTINGWIGTAPNLAAPGKRMLSSMTPTILTKDGQLFLVLGSPGGRTIINTVLQVVVNLIDHQQSLAAAVAAPRLHHQWFPDEILFEPEALSGDTRERLTQWGHRLRENPHPQGAVTAIRFDASKNQLEGVADPRSPDAAALGW